MSEDILVVVDDLGFDGLEVDDDVDKLLKAFHKSQVKELHICLRTFTACALKLNKYDIAQEYHFLQRVKLIEAVILTKQIAFQERFDWTTKFSFHARIGNHTSNKS